ncbi:glycylpeptide N-tetradecanoyltransferase 2-like isoform X3 [Nerophis ophidion]|uniref:glycylpeptide N-tetradecanoyltransferase 2-like isoform X3 n=1 Tax=Nerophis ophidion TaxID=159077 RepID=UPI002ADF7A42|nr:glycylpeptide N-tetradecanoyltransferase 2-like isoform X3 [Nerophis ophidion]
MSDFKSADKKLADDDASGASKSKKKQDKRRQEGPRDAFEMLDALPEKKQQEIQRALHLFSLGQTLPRTLQQAMRRTYKFWDTQPVPKLAGEVITSQGQITEVETSVRVEPYSLPQGFSWDTVDPSNPTELRELCTLLNENFTEDDDNTIRYDFSMDYLQWALQPPNWLAQWHCGVRVDSNKKLVGFIGAVPADVHIYDTLWHRPLNLRKLMEVQYPGLRRDMPLQRALKVNRLPEMTKTPGLRPMNKDDVVRTHALLQANLSKFHLRPSWSLQEAEHWLLPREGVVDTYVVEGNDGALTDVVSFYRVSSKVLNHPVHTGLSAAHLFYVASDGCADLAELIEDTLVLAKFKGLDIFVVLDVMDNRSFLEKLKFSMSGKDLNYYLYNWMCPRMSPDKVGIVLPN